MPKNTLNLDEMKKDPVEFSRQVLKFDPHEGQVELLRGIRKRTVIRAGRQWGKSVSLAVYVVWWLVTHPKKNLLLAAPTVDQAKIIYKEVVNHLRGSVLSTLIDKITEHPFPEIYLKNGSSLLGRGTSNADYVRGKKIHKIICDETAFIKDDTIKYVLLPMLTVTGQEPDAGIVMISTPFGGGEFQDQYQLCERRMLEGDPDYSAFHFTSLDNPYADKKYLEEIKEESGGEDSLLWQTEYLAEFADSDLSVFKTADILAAIEAYPYETFPVAPVEDHKYVQGIDLANMRDYFVASMMDVTKRDLCPVVRMDRHQQKSYGYYKGIIRSNYNRYNYPESMIDATSLGQTVAEDLRDIRAEGYVIGSSAAKWELVQELARMFQERRIAIPNDQTIRNELRYFSYEITKSKQIKMEARKGHDDIVISLAFCARLANRPLFTGFFRGVDLPKKSMRRPPRFAFLQEQD